MNYREIPALAAYIDRIGAEQLNFRKFMVKEYRGNYYIEKSYIEIARDGTISCSNEIHAPTEEEITAIKAALQNVNFPQYVLAGAGQLRSLRMLIEEEEGGTPILYEFWKRSDDKMIMVQQRKSIGEGRKRYIPWTMWSDGIWRRMEPDTVLPLWKPKEDTLKQKIMIHEGAKAAHFIHGLLHDRTRAAERAAHPWAEELNEYEHWGFIGGALAPQRTDWASVKSGRPMDVVYVCDNDFQGMSALQYISNHLRYRLKGVKFNSHWPQSWDLADPMPVNLFRNGRWIGPTLKSLMEPATWATERLTIPNSKKQPIVIRREFAEEWLHSVKPEVYVNINWPSDVLTMQEFNNKVKPYSDTDDTARLLKAAGATKAGVLKYSPALPSGVYNVNNDRFINTHEPSAIKAEQGDYSPWLDFARHLVPDDQDRTELFRWCATLIARPNIKMMYGMLLISETQGVGKGTLGEKILAPLVGPRNVSYPSEAEIVDSNYNYWASHKRLAVVHEIYAGHSAKAYNKLKSIITDHNIVVSQKYMANYLIENWIHIFACSNSIRALKLTMDDRRWFVPKITDDKLTMRYWADFNDWLENQGGLGKIKFWAEEWLGSNEAVISGAAAPWSTMKQEVIMEGYSAGQEWVANFLIQAKQEMNGTPVVVTDIGLREGIKAYVHGGRDSTYLESKETIRKTAKHIEDYNIGEGYVFINHKRTKLISTDRAMANTTGDNLASLPIIDVVQKAREWYQQHNEQTARAVHQSETEQM